MYIGGPGSICKTRQEQRKHDSATWVGGRKGVKRLRSLGDLFRGSDVGIIHLNKRVRNTEPGNIRDKKHLCCESQGTQRLVHMHGQGRQVQDHQGF